VNPAALLSIFPKYSLEAIVGLVHIELELSRLLVVELLGRSHLVQGDEPLHNLALIFELLICDLVDRLDDFDQERVEGIFLH